MRAGPPWDGSPTHGGRFVPSRLAQTVPRWYLAFLRNEDGEYQNASESVRDALRVLQQRRREDALKLKALRYQIKAGGDALKRGEFLEIDETDVEQYLEELATDSR